VRCVAPHEARHVFEDLHAGRGRFTVHAPMTERQRPPRLVGSYARGRLGPFGALLAAAARDPAAARGLALAYASLDAEGRSRIVQAVVDDAAAEGISASVALAPLLAVEEEPQIARAIADAIGRDGGLGLERSSGPRALLAGDERAGGVLLVRPLHGTFVEVLALAWDAERGVTHSVFDPLVDDAMASAHTSRLPSALRFEDVPVGYAIDRIAPVLWNHRRTHGTLPPGVERFADLFSIGLESD
jgi:hypothetical protein